MVSEAESDGTAVGGTAEAQVPGWGRVYPQVHSSAIRKVLTWCLICTSGWCSSRWRCRSPSARRAGTAHGRGPPLTGPTTCPAWTPARSLCPSTSPLRCSSGLSPWATACPSSASSRPSSAGLSALLAKVFCIGGHCCCVGSQAEQSHACHARLWYLQCTQQAMLV